MKSNDFVALALKSPLHILMGNTMLVTLTGCKSGNRIEVPVNYYREGNNLWIISTQDRKWWRNLVHGGEVDVRIHGRVHKGFAEVLLEEADVAGQVLEYVRHLPISARYIGVRVENSEPNREDAARVAKQRLFVRVCLVA